MFQENVVGGVKGMNFIMVDEVHYGGYGGILLTV